MVVRDSAPEFVTEEMSMSGIVNLWKTNKVFKYGTIVLLVVIVLGAFTYFGSGVPTAE
jgi:diacylglycerol kinase